MGLFSGKAIFLSIVGLVCVQSATLAPFGETMQPTNDNPPPDATDITQWSRWSDPQTWPDGIVPTTGVITISSNMSVAFDLPALPGGTPTLNLDELNIFGNLLLWDDPTVGNITINAAYIYVFGTFQAGSLQQHLR
jgi:hypothetical protein